MSKSEGPSSLKRKRPELLSKGFGVALVEQEKVLHDLIHSKQSMGICTFDMKRETKFSESVVTKSLKSLQAKGLIKLVQHYQNKGKKFSLSKDFEPAKELTGGNWYRDRTLDREYIDTLKGVCARLIQKRNVITIEGIVDSFKRSGASKVDLSWEQIEEIVNALVLDHQVMEVKSTGSGEFDIFPIGKICYKCHAKGGVKEEPKTGAMTSIPWSLSTNYSLHSEWHHFA
ncbi:DNA-directed RNA polymerase III subunit rpc6-like [Momordica charantia]|uniref:DNA-directed RNA polymerase III subunit rpc6-like n=1 Tax=Momordica charantia TaxID=3673 RepID=A0A6J1DSU1_MOMCH|nr:DNA-directed RNA polymerase III subunit rpc6-like [Momordica charantia]XP_022157223.1 DNA-directed RNA polymerase III subunit rpc6-like [Momordica charantia]XP_022157224.1 DNA-directed RNA polymerase III subunit rpc6-like [Momordica charantia]